jgi:replicative DNA helicase
MASIEEVRAGIALANDKASESMGALQQAHESLEQAQSALLQVTEGSNQSDVSEANGLLAQAVGSIQEVQQAVSAAIQASEGVANRL